MFDVDPAEGAVRFRTWVQKPKGRCAGLNAKRQTLNVKLQTRTLPRFRMDFLRTSDPIAKVTKWKLGDFTDDSKRVGQQRGA